MWSGFPIAGSSSTYKIMMAISAATVMADIVKSPNMK